MLLNAIEAFYRNSKAYIMINRKEGEMFEKVVGLEQGCVMSTWCINIGIIGKSIFCSFQVIVY